MNQGLRLDAQLDRADHDFAGVRPDPDLQIDSLSAQLFGVAA